MGAATGSPRLLPPLEPWGEGDTKLEEAAGRGCRAPQLRVQPRHESGAHSPGSSPAASCGLGVHGLMPPLPPKHTAPAPAHSPAAYLGDGSHPLGSTWQVPLAPRVSGGQRGLHSMCCARHKRWLRLPLAGSCEGGTYLGGCVARSTPVCARSSHWPRWSRRSW